jgi:hypothetical protein
VARAAERHHPLEREANLLEHPDRSPVGRIRYRHEPPQAEPLARVIPDREGGFNRIPFRPELREKGEADVDILQLVALQQTADADCCP